MNPLPATAAEFAEQIIAPTFREVLPGKFDSPEARLILLAIAKQESDLRYRLQVNGPARGPWQFEQGGGVHGVLTHAASRVMMRAVCLLRAVAPTEHDLYMALGHDDLLACATARMLLWTDAAPLPAIGNEQAAFDCYRRTWNPGAWHRDQDGVRMRWHASYVAAMVAAR